MMLMLMWMACDTRVYFVLYDRKRLEKKLMRGGVVNLHGMERRGAEAQRNKQDTNMGSERARLSKTKKNGVMLGKGIL